MKKSDTKSNNNLGLITGLFDINNDGKLDIVEEALLIATLTDTPEETKKSITKKQSQLRKVVNLDDIDIEGIWRKE